MQWLTQKSQNLGDGISGFAAFLPNIKKQVHWQTIGKRRIFEKFNVLLALLKRFRLGPHIIFKFSRPDMKFLLNLEII